LRPNLLEKSHQLLPESSHRFFTKKEAVILIEIGINAQGFVPGTEITVSGPIDKNSKNIIRTSGLPLYL
jgi:hypothetical protein